MKKFILAAALCIAGPVVVNAQHDHRVCGATEMIQKAMENDRSYYINHQRLEEFTQEYIRQNAGFQRSSGTIQYVIPVVFHIIHEYGGENISKAQVLDAVEVLNRSFQKWYPDSVQVASAFRPIIADCEIEFRLAQLDPNGNCTDGITRTYSSLTRSAGDNVKGLIQWPSNNYFNIWVVANIASGAAGYAYYPGIAANIDGVVILHNYTGYIGTNSGSNYAARSLVHEAGHWLNLPHTWGSTNNPGLPGNCSDDDFVQDTPNTIGVANFSCDTTQVTCGSLDNVQNYMDYASCHLMFTEGQKMRMHAALNSFQGQRSNLHTQNNLNATGTNDGFVPGACAPIADFTNDIRFICSGSTINFADLSWRSDATSWQWDFPGGSPSSSTDQNPVVTYNTPGIYDVTLTASNAGGSNTLTRNGVIVVSEATASNVVPFMEDFENSGPIPSGSNWIIENAAGNPWGLVATVGYNSSKSMRLINHSGNANGTVDAFITPGYNLTNITNASMTFQVAFAARSSSSTDQLKVFASSNCGQQWNIRFTKSGLNLSTAGIVSASFIPNASQWRQETVNINSVSYNNKPSVRFKFEYTQNTGNNIYIDNINVTGTSTVGIQDVQFLATLSVYPNPSATGSLVEFQLSEPTDMTIEVTDIAGRVVEQLEKSRLHSGSYSYRFGDNYPAGIYFVRLKPGVNDITQKVIFTR
jgi:PKD repeat protein